MNCKGYNFGEFTGEGLN